MGVGTVKTFFKNTWPWWLGGLATALIFVLRVYTHP